MTKRPRAVGYVRVSDESQVDGYSLGAQKDEIVRWCERQSYELVRFYADEGISAFTDRIERRPQLQALLGDAERGLFDFVAVHTLDRWARNVGVQTQHDGTCRIVPHQAEAVREVFRRRAAGESMAAIASWLNERGLTTKKGRLFTAHAVRDMLMCRFYLGIVQYRGEEYPAKHEAIVSEDLYTQVQARRQQRTFQRQVHGPTSPFQGRSSCLRCGNSLQADRHRLGTPMLRERHSHPCETNGVSTVTPCLADQLGLIFASLELPASWREEMAKVAVEAHDGPSLAALQDRRRRLGRAYTDGAFSDAEYHRFKAELDARIRAATVVAQPTLEEAAAIFNSLRDLWAEATLDEKGRLVAPLIERFYIDMEAKRIGAMTPAPAFRTLLERALKRSRRSDVFLASFQELERQEVWRWWRRGRVELPVQRRAHLRHYRHVRRFISSGGPSPARPHRT